jgi:hypothetical protein
MGNEVIFLGWNRAVPGREQMSAAHFQEFVGYLTELQGQGAIDSFQTVLLNQHGGDLNGFFLIQGDRAQFDVLTVSDEWQNHVTRGGLHLEGMGVVRGVTGDGVMEWMGRWSAILPE